MDTTKEYFDMCREANKFFPEHEWDYGDFFVINGDMMTIGDCTLNENRDSGISTYSPSGFERELKPEYFIPRQDQLQEMVKGMLKGKFLLDFTSNGVEVCEIKMTGAWSSYSGSSLEQVWLKWTMDIKFNRKWNGKTWEVV